jgi:hypothetical protein
MPTNNADLRSGRRVRNGLFAATILAFSMLAGCGDDDDGGSPNNTGQACTAADQCYPGVKAGQLMGDAVCMDKVTGGYCTHVCTQDTDCCAAAGECAGNRAEVCSPFESMGDMYCLLSCEDDDLKKTTITDPDVYCHTYVGANVGCRSSGGGSQNRKICMP